MQNMKLWQAAAMTVAACSLLSGCRMTPELATAEKIKQTHPVSASSASDLESISEEPLSEAAESLSPEEMSEALTETDLDQTTLGENISAGVPVSETALPTSFWPQHAAHLIPGYELLASAALSAPEKSLSMLQMHLEKLLATYEGTWSVCICDLNAEETITINDIPMPSASLMKLFILGCAYDEIRNGRLDRTSELVAQMSGMIRVSSNEDANKVIAALGGGDHKAGIRKVNRYIQKSGYSAYSVLYNPFQNPSLVFDAEHTNQTTAKDCVQLFSNIYHRNFSSRKDCNEAEEWLLGQEIRYKLPSISPEGVTIGNKTGETDTIENDTAIFYTPKGDYIVSVLSTDWTNKNGAQTHIKELSAEIYRYFSNETYSAVDFHLPTLPADDLTPVSIQQVEIQKK